jgi:hypothetical protein
MCAKLTTPSLSDHVALSEWLKRHASTMVPRLGKESFPRRSETRLTFVGEELMQAKLASATLPLSIRSCGSPLRPFARCYV